MTRNLILPALSVLLFANVAWSDPPMKHYFYVQEEALQKAARKFSPAGADEFIKALEASRKTTAFERRPFFRKDDAIFTQVPEFPLFNHLMTLIKPAVKRNEIASVDLFLAELTDAKIIQGYELSRLGGPFHVVLKLTSDREGIWMLSSQYRQLRILDEYQGPTVRRSLQIRKTSSE